MENKDYAVIVVGGGPAGLSTALVTARAGRPTLVVEKMIPGGQMNRIKKLTNYPGTPEISGSDLADIMYAQAVAAGVKFVFGQPTRIDLMQKTVTISAIPSSVKRFTTNDKVYQAAHLVIATGKIPQPLPALVGGDKFTANGVHYCAPCDGPLYQNQNVVVYGDDATALDDALFLAGVCHQVIVANPHDAFAAPNEKLQLVRKQPKITRILYNTQITALTGDTQINQVTLVVNGKAHIVAANAVFVALGETAQLDHVVGKLKLDAHGFVVTDANCATNLSGVYAVGDVRSKACRQVATAVGDGITAGTDILRS